MDIQTLCRKIQMPEVVVAKILNYAQFADFKGLTELSMLMNSDTGLNGFHKLEQVLGNDPTGIKQLTCQLHCACLRYETYREMGISEQVYFDTMSCYARFVTECLYYKGEYQFDRGWWTWRQLSMTVFRLGQLEYELRPEHTISMHIPTGADLSAEAVDRSLATARAFFSLFFPDYSNVEFTCNSWLLVPVLEELLEEGSNILNFQRRFTLRSMDSESTAYVGWLFQCMPDADPRGFPENTSLQRKAKQFILNGGKIGSAAGYLNNG